MYRDTQRKSNKTKAIMLNDSDRDKPSFYCLLHVVNVVRRNFFVSCNWWPGDVSVLDEQKSFFNTIDRRRWRELCIVRVAQR